MAESMVAHRWTWCCRVSCEFYMKIGRQQRETLGLAWEFETSILTSSDTVSPTRPHITNAIL